MARSPVDAERWEGAGSIAAGNRTYRFALGTVRGNARRVNEDAAVVDPSLRLVAVLDGMGGIASGAEASRVIIDGLLVALAASTGGDETRLREAFHAAAARITAAVDEDRTLYGSGASTVAGLVDAAGVTVVHAGDCRAYLLRAGKLMRCTRDHDLARALAESGATDQEMADVLAKISHVITTAIAAEVPCKPDAIRVELHVGDRMVFVTDGVHELVDEAALTRLIDGDAPTAARALLDQVASLGRDDGAVTVVDVDAGPR